MMEVNVKSTHDYEPFGVELQPLSDDSTNFKYKYTGQERDYKTGLDYMHFRFYTSSMGRFLKPDNIIPNAANPQSWNLYSYVNGNPVNFNDPTGHEAAEPDQQLTHLQGNGNNQNMPTSDRSITPPTNENQEMEKKLITYVVKITEPNKSVTAVQVSISSQNGKLDVSVTTAKENTTKLSSADLSTMQNTVKTIYEASGPSNTSKEVAVAIAMGESRLGKNDPNNPMQYKGAGYEKNSMAENIKAGIGILETGVRQCGLYNGLRYYNWGNVKDKEDYQIIRYGQKETAHPLKESTAYANQIGEIVDNIVQTYGGE